MTRWGENPTGKPRLPPARTAAGWFEPAAPPVEPEIGNKCQVTSQWRVKAPAQTAPQTPSDSPCHPERARFSPHRVFTQGCPKVVEAAAAEDKKLLAGRTPIPGRPAPGRRLTSRGCHPHRRELITHQPGPDRWVAFDESSACSFVSHLQDCQPKRSLFGQHGPEKDDATRRKRLVQVARVLLHHPCFLAGHVLRKRRPRRKKPQAEMLRAHAGKYTAKMPSSNGFSHR